MEMLFYGIIGTLIISINWYFDVKHLNKIINYHNDLTITKEYNNIKKIYYLNIIVIIVIWLIVFM